MAKPRGCRVYPATFVDDGEHIRVSMSVECPCVLASAGVEGGAPLVDPEARTRADLINVTRVGVLPARIAPPASNRCSVRVVLPASGWLMIAKVRRRAASAAGEVGMAVGLQAAARRFNHVQ